MMKLYSLLFCIFCISNSSLCQTKTEAFFHRSSGDIIDTNGQRFLLRATNVSCWLYQENYIFGGAQNVHETAKKNLNDILGPNVYEGFSKKMMEHFITSDDIILMKKMGFNSVRVGFSAESFENDSTKSWLFSSLDRLIPVFRENNIAIIITMMRASKPQNKLWTSNYTKGATLLWDSEEAKQKTVAIWSEIAGRYKHEPIILGYDIMNEPNIPKKREKEFIDLYQK
ncbi:MAG: glycoside hydrolase family 5 protein, partial [Crocinitomicaceae bacterium]